MERVKEDERWVITITFAEQVENHAGMERRGKLAPEGFTVQELQECASRLPGARFLPLDEPSVKGSEGAAGVLIIKNGVNTLLAMQDEDAADKMYNEQRALEVDKKAKMRGRVVNKRARWNLCFDDEPQEPDYEAGKGRIVSFSDLEWTRRVREALPLWLQSEKARNLKAEGNYYYDSSKCYIGFHNDLERKIVVAVRLGAPMLLHYQWYQRHEPIGQRFELELEHGDIYVMSEKATGNDGRRSIIPTLRHAAGSRESLGLA